MSHATRVLSVLLAINVKAMLAYISWNTASVTVRHGDNLNLTCTVANFEFMDVIRISVKNSDDRVLTIADNTDIKLPFSSIPRYKVEFRIQNNQGFVTIAYKDIKGEDSGTLLCNKLTNGNETAEMKLHVQDPVKEIYLRQKTLNEWKRLQEMELVTLREIEDNELECVATIVGGLTPTDLSVSIGNEDKTQFFTASEESKFHKDRESDLGMYISDFKLLYSSMNPLREFNGLTMTCTAVQQDFNNVSASALLRIEYSPVIMCDKYEHHSKLGGSVDFVCEIDANPMSHFVTWVMDSLHQSKPIRLDLVNMSSLQMSETVLDDHRKQVKLTIGKVEQMHFTSYHLSATNEVSTAEVTLILLPASLELSQIPSAQDQMMYFLQQQQMPETEMALSSGWSWTSEHLSILNTFILVSVILSLSC